MGNIPFACTESMEGVANLLFIPTQLCSPCARVIFNGALKILYTYPWILLFVLWVLDNVHGDIDLTDPCVLS